MATPNVYKHIQIIIDGIYVAALTDYNIELETYDIDRALKYQENGEPNARLMIYGDGFTLRIKPESIAFDETQDATIVYVYGVFDKVFPSLFKSLKLEEWQKAYVETQTSDIIERHSIWRDDPMFTTLNAHWFRKGWESKI